MKAKYCIVPDTAKFFEFLAGLSFSESEAFAYQADTSAKDFVDVEQSEWVIEYKAAAPVEERLALAVADKLAAAFSLHKVELSCCNAEANVKAETEEIPLRRSRLKKRSLLLQIAAGSLYRKKYPCRKNRRKTIWKLPL